jgi:hypothetical protein
MQKSKMTIEITPEGVKRTLYLNITGKIYVDHCSDGTQRQGNAVFVGGGEKPIYIQLEDDGIFDQEILSAVSSTDIKVIQKLISQL